MAAQYWTITKIATGEVLHPAFATESTGVHPKDRGWAWDAATQKATRIDKLPDPVTKAWGGTAWADDLAKVKAVVLDQIKGEAERRKMALLSAGGAKKAEYAEKRQEVVNWDTLASGVGGITQALTTLSTPRREVMFAHATADALTHGDTQAAAIARFRAGIAKSANTPSIAAAEQAVCDAIRAATTPAAARAAAAAVKWP